jgi:hypothetical protein
MNALTLEWSKATPPLTLQWYSQIKAGPFTVTPETSLEKLVTIVALAPPGGAPQHLEFIQNSAQPTWIIPHNFNRIPIVVLMDLSDEVIEGNVRHLDDNTAQVDFSVAVAGKAQLYA